MKTNYIALIEKGDTYLVREGETESNLNHVWMIAVRKTMGNQTSFTRRYRSKKKEMITEEILPTQQFSKKAKEIGDTIIKMRLNQKPSLKIIK